MRAAIVISRMILVKILPRLASSAPFLCLIECHLECPDMRRLLRELTRTSLAPSSTGQRGLARKKKAPAIGVGARRGMRKKIPATSYSPTRLPWQYHRRWRA